MSDTKEALVTASTELRQAITARGKAVLIELAEKIDWVDFSFKVLFGLDMGEISSDADIAETFETGICRQLAKESWVTDALHGRY